MNRIAVWTANAGLFVLCCYLLASIVNQIAAGSLSPAVGATAPRAVAPVARERSWSERQAILDRNLFGSSTEASAVAAVEEDVEYAATKLPLKLLGTAASSLAALSWAAVEDIQKKEHQVVRVRDTLLEKATVVAIERRRIVLENGGRREELALTEDPTPSPNTATRGRVDDLRERVQRMAEGRFTPSPPPAVPLEDVTIAGRSPAEIFSSARNQPKYEQGQMVGIQLNNVKAGSLFEEMGIQNGDVITQVNGIQIDSPQGSAEVLRELTEAETIQVEVKGPDGTPRSLSLSNK